MSSNGINEQITIISNDDNDENFLKKFSKDFYQEIIENINIKELNNKFQDDLIEWINNLEKDNETILELMENHKNNEIWFSSIIGFFYQYGIGCNINKDKSFELYLLIIKNNNNNDKKEFLNQTISKNLNLLEEKNIKDFDIFKYINNIIGKYLLSLFYYKDIIIDMINLKYMSDVVINYLKSARKNDSIAQFNLGYCYGYGEGVPQDCEKAFEWYSTRF
ncbi:unnamed protein product [Rhizophagus irregularis]|nr:unnamed protein product [Rhizophagus irregularis]